MRVALASDFHLGYSEDAFEQARDALRKASEADVVVVAGDLFDVRVPKQETLHEAIRLFTEFKENRVSGCVVSVEGRQFDSRLPIVIYGNHDRRAKGLVNPVQLLEVHIGQILKLYL